MTEAAIAELAARAGVAEAFAERLVAEGSGRAQGPGGAAQPAHRAPGGLTRMRIALFIAIHRLRCSEPAARAAGTTGGRA